MTYPSLESPRSRLHLAVALFVGLVLPAGSLLEGNGVFAWTMFSKSETYRITVVGIGHDGETLAFDPRELIPHVNPSLGYFLPAKDTWRHDPVGLTFRTGLGQIAVLACKLAPLRSTEITLEERRDLDAPPKDSVARANCR